MKMKRKRWSKALVIAALKERKAAGKALNYQAVVFDDERLAVAARRRFGSWDAALAAAGLDPADIRKCRAWTPDTVVAAIRTRHQQGQALNFYAVWQDDTGLIHAGKRCFGSWDGSLAAAGYDPAVIRHPGRERVPYRSWSRATIVARIQADAVAGLDMCATAVQKRSQSNLVSQAVYYFGSWGAACEAAGLNYADIRKGPARLPHEPQANTVGAYIRRRRKELGMTAQDLAVRIGRSASHVGHLEHGRRGMSDETRARLAEALECSIDELRDNAAPQE